MRTISDQLQAVYDAFPTLPSVWTIVEIDLTGSGDWVNMSELYNRDWVVSATHTTNLDTPVDTATVVFRARFDALNLSPYVLNSPLNGDGILIQAYRRIRIRTATLPMGYCPTDSDYVLVFRGRITQWAIRGDEITVQCRDDGGELQDLFIETADITRGADDGSVQVEEVMQDILDDHAATAGVTMYGPSGSTGTPFPGGDSPGWAIAAYKQQRQPVMSALMVLAESLGYSVRYRFLESDVNDFVLVFEQPPRSKTTPDFVLNVLNVESMSADLADIRNVVRVVYEDTGGRRQTLNFTDATSVTKYGRRWMEIQEESVSQIDEASEATTLGNGALDDLKEPETRIAVTVPYFYPVQLTDLLRFSDPSKAYLDGTLDLGPTSIVHTPTSGTSRIVGMGKPSMRKRAWVARQGRHPLREFGSFNFSNGAAIDPTGVLPNGLLRNWTKG